MLAIPLAHLAAGDGVAPDARSADEVRQASKLASKAYATKIVGWDKIFERDLACEWVKSHEAQWTTWLLQDPTFPKWLHCTRAGTRTFGRCARL